MKSLSRAYLRARLQGWPWPRQDIPVTVRGDQRIEVTVDRGHGPVKTTVDPKVLARQMGVDKDAGAD